MGTTAFPALAPAPRRTATPSRPTAGFSRRRGGRFYAPEDGGDLYTFGSDGRVSLLYHDTHNGSHEGLKYAGLGLRWLIDEGPGKQRIHYISAVP